MFSGNKAITWALAIAATACIIGAAHGENTKGDTKPFNRSRVHAAADPGFIRVSARFTWYFQNGWRVVEWRTHTWRLRTSSSLAQVVLYVYRHFDYLDLYNLMREGMPREDLSAILNALLSPFEDDNGWMGLLYRNLQGMIETVFDGNWTRENRGSQCSATGTGPSIRSRGGSSRNFLNLISKRCDDYHDTCRRNHVTLKACRDCVATCARVTCHPNLGSRRALHSKMRGCASRWVRMGVRCARKNKCKSL